MTTLRLATRRSALALAQSRQIAAALAAAVPGLRVEEVQIVTQGDRVVDRPLTDIGGKGLFVREIEEALLERRADLAVHSMKDLPAQMPVGLVLAAVPKRESPFDALVTKDGTALAALPAGARVGTSSLRRTRSLLALRADLDVQFLRGNVDTRLRRLAAGDFDAVVLAEAGLRRLGLDPPRVLLDEGMVPAVAQGALALQTRTDDAVTREIVMHLHDVRSALEVAAERAVLETVSGDCGTPLGVLARLDAAGSLSMRGFYVDPATGRAAHAESVTAVPDLEGARVAGCALGRALRS